jgi:4-amino-4-deoxy-L-arabinose transferase-like glycosyltransferase
MESLPHHSKRVRTIAILIAVIVICSYAASFLYMKSISDQNSEVPAYPIVPGDSLSYVQYADTMLQHGVFADLPDLTPHRMWPPGYPALLATVKAVTGSYLPIILIQTALAILAAWLVYLIARRFVREWLAIAAALVFALDPMVIFSNTTLMSDGIFASMVVIAVYLGFFAARPGLVLRWGLVALILASATMMRAIGQYLVYVIPLVFLARELYGRTSPWRVNMRALLVYALIATLCLAPWMARNYEVFGKAEIAHGGPGNLMFWFVRDFLAWREMEKTQPTSIFYPARHLDAPAFAAVDREIEAAFAAIAQRGERRDNYDGAVAKHFIVRDPLHYAEFHLAHLAPYFLSGSATAYRQIAQQQRYSEGFSSSTLNALKSALADPLDFRALGFVLPILIECAALLAITLLALIGWFVERRRIEIWILAGLIGYFAILTGPLAMARYRVPAAPYIAILAAVGAYAMLSRMYVRPAHERAEKAANSPQRISLADVSVVIPCYNEEHSIRPVIEAIPQGVREIVLVDNNSTDGSARVAEACGARVVREEKQGYGAALKCGFHAARGSIIASFDADNQYPAEELTNILAYLNDNNLDFVSASRFPLTESASMNKIRRLGNWGFTFIANTLFGLSLTDSQSGMWVFKRDLIDRILPKSDDMPLSQEIKILAALAPDVRFAEYHIPYRVRIGESKLFPIRHGIMLLISLATLRVRRWFRIA